MGETDRRRVAADARCRLPLEGEGAEEQQNYIYDENREGKAVRTIVHAIPESKLAANYNRLARHRFPFYTLTTGA